VVLDPAAPPYPTAPTVFDLMDRGPRLEELHPGRSRVALFSSGGLGVGEGWPLVEAMAERWPAVVVRLGEDDEAAVPVVPVIQLLPEPVRRASHRPAVYQAMSRSEGLPGPGVRLPPLGRGRLLSLIGGQLQPRSRWVRGFAPVWSLPWP
jgi:hypothetical protein